MSVISRGILEIAPQNGHNYTEDDMSGQVLLCPPKSPERETKWTNGIKTSKTTERTIPAVS